MNLDHLWLLLIALPIAFGLGWAASRVDWHQLRVIRRSAPRTYFKGLTYLLNEQPDKAIDVFVEAVQDDPDTVELHFALGSLFRRRGEYDRAVRVHEHLLARADLSKADHVRAKFDLAQDFLKAGLLDRAEALFQQIKSPAQKTQANMALLFIYERVHDWDKAVEVSQEISSYADRYTLQTRQMHYLCEQAQIACVQKDYARAENLLTQSFKKAPASLRPRVERVKLLLLQGFDNQAFELFDSFAQEQSGLVALLVNQITQLKLEEGQLHRVHAVLKQNYLMHPSLDVLLCLVETEKKLGFKTPEKWYLEHIRQTPSLVAAARWISSAAQQADINESLEKAVLPLMRYRCLHCGFESHHYFWQCPGCQSWESFPARRVEELT